MNVNRKIKPSFLTAILLGATLTSFASVPVSANDQLKLPPVKKVKLKNGMTLLLMERHGVPIVSFNVIVKAGSVADPVGKEGLAAITADMLKKGTKARTEDQISEQTDFIGGEVGFDAGGDFTRGAAEFLKKDIDKGLDLLSDVMINPTFPQDEVEKDKKQTIDQLKSAKDDASNVIGIYFDAFLYGDHPYARPVDGTETSIANITRDDILKFYESYYSPSNTILAVAGDINIADMENVLTSKFEPWSGGPSPKIELKDAPAVKGKRLLLVDKPDSTQTYFMIGNVGIARTNPDRVYINVVNTLFGGRFTSLLNSGLRINSGLTYGADSSFEQLRAAGPFAISSYTANESTEKAIDMALSILKDLHEKGITEQQLTSAKNYIKGQYPPRVETSDQLASLMTTLEYYGLDESDVNNLYAKIDSMTLADANRIIKQYFPTDDLVFVLIGKASEIQKIASKYAPQIKVKSISDPSFN
ncbi:MAG TPA: pitrilysin family protein [Blastocatellia bacterium]|nr:pitrilysin family protein [Blastocatellia bacterium]